MKIKILSLIALFFTIIANAQIVNIPDANFKAALVGNSNINTNNDSEIQVSEANAFNDYINVSNLNISDLTGIEAFINLTELNCSNNNLSSLDITNNTSLYTLDCSNNNLISLDFSGNTSIVQLYCNDNALTSLNVTNCTSLTTLYCQNNQLTQLDVTTNLNLIHLYCQNNQLTSLDLSHNTVLNTILCQNNALIFLDVSNTAWKVLDCSNNQLTNLDVGNGLNTLYEYFDATLNNLIYIAVDDPNYSTINWSNDVDSGVTFGTGGFDCVIAITDVNFYDYLINNPLINVNGDDIIQCVEAHSFTGTINAGILSIADLTGIEEFWNLSILRVNNNQLTSIDLTNNGSLTELVCSNNQLTSLDLSQNTILTHLDCHTNLFNNSIDLSNNTALTYLDIRYNQISSIDLSQNLMLETLYCRDNQLLNLNVSLNTSLTILNCVNNQLSSLNVKNGNNQNFTVFYATVNPNLTCITVDDPAWSTTNWSSFIDSTASFSNSCLTYVPDDNFEQALIDLGYDSGPLDDYVPTANIASEDYLDVSSKNISDLTGIEGFASLQTLLCYDNQITNLDMSENAALVHLFAFTNTLQTLDVSSNLNLIELAVFQNQLTAIDVSPNTHLEKLDVSNNLLTSLNVKNGNNINFTIFEATNNSGLTCISVDNPSWSTTNWTNIDATASFGQNCISGVAMTYVPDDNFEQELINLGYDSGALDDYVPTANIDTITSLDVSSKSIADLTGIEDFTALTVLNCDNNNLTNLDITNLAALEELYASHNNISGSIDVSNNTVLRVLNCGYNQLTTLDLSNNTALQYFSCYVNQLTALDLSQNTALKRVKCQNNQLTSLNVKNGNNTAVANSNFISTNNPNLTCVLVDDATWSATNWTNIDAQTSFNDVHCSPPGMTYVPDDNFEQALIDLGYDSGALDDYVPTANINAVTTLDVASKNITDLTGIEDFVTLNYLSCHDNNLTALDISNNTALTILNCDTNHLAALDVSSNTALVTLICYANQLTALTISNNTALTHLNCINNQLTAIDVSQNTALTAIYCDQNLLTSLDVSTNTALNDLNCSLNQLNTLDVSNNTALTILRCGNNNLNSLDVSNNTSLTTISCHFNNLSVLNVPNNTALTDLSCNNNSLTSLDVSNNTALTNLKCNDNQLTSLNVKNGNNTAISNSSFKATNNPNLTCILVDDATWSTTNWTNIDATASFNDVTCEPRTYVPDDNFEQALIDLGRDDVLDDYVLTANINNLTVLNIWGRNITDLTGIADFDLLSSLSCQDNQLTSLDISHNTALTFLNCSQNQLTNLDVSSNTALTYLSCYQNQLTSLDVTNNAALEYIYCENNQITSLDVPNNTAVININCSNNQLAALSVSNNTVLEELKCYQNQITALDLSSNTVLTKLYCYQNQITALDLSNNTVLSKLHCYNNQLTTLNVKNGNNSAIPNFYFKTYNNPNLTCILVDDATWSAANWTNIDATSTFVNNQAACDALYVDDASFEEAINIYPNPAKNSITIANNGNEHIDQITIYNALGAVVFKANSIQNSIDTSNFKTGIYLVQLISDKKSLTKKLIIRK